MSFVSPLWLLGLIPWAAVVLWLLSGKRPQSQVPFINLWRNTQPAPPRQRPKLRLPPSAMACMLLAMLLGVLGAAQPRLTWLPYTMGPELTIIVDRGITMSARGAQDPRQRRYQETAQLVRQPLVSVFGFGPTHLIMVPGGPSIETDRLDWYRLLDDHSPPPTDTRPLLRGVVLRALEQQAGPVIVLSDQNLGIDDPRLIHVPPPIPPKNVGIVSLSARRSTSPQLMLRVRNDSDFTSTMLKIDIDGRETLRRLDLPARGQEKNFFIDVAGIAERVTVELQVDDDIAVDNSASLVVKQSWPTIETGGALPDEVRRVIEAYAKLRPGTATSARMLVTSEPAATNVPAVIVAAGKENLLTGVLEVQEHPINESVDWGIAPADATVADATGEGWRAVVSAGGRPLVAVRDAPARQVWVGFWSDSLARTSKFVVLWSNILDWVGRGGETYDKQGTAAVPVPAPFETDWLAKTHAMTGRNRKGIDLASGLLLIAVGLILVAVMLWAGR